MGNDLWPRQQNRHGLLIDRELVLLHGELACESLCFHSRLNGHVTRSSVHNTLLVHGLCSELGLINMTSCTVPSQLNWVLHVILNCLLVLDTCFHVHVLCTVERLVCTHFYLGMAPSSNNKEGKGLGKQEKLTEEGYRAPACTAPDIVILLYLFCVLVM